MHPFSHLPELPNLAAQAEAGLPPPPEDAACFALWRKYGMLPNVERHSHMVAHIATALARRAAERGLPVSVETVRASALLHDLAKTYCLFHGGSHAQLGASWALAETRNYALARGVLLHVHWPWAVPEGPGICALPFFVIYADKRVRHDACVTLEERFEDLLARYGRDARAREGIRAAHDQALAIERALAAQLGWKLHEDTFDCRGLVQ
ncbi:MAG: HDIG domain-containing protein [Desulfovibrio sp.]|nr:HDIG domain-containing protein [Desulfovibrio sp.]